MSRFASNPAPPTPLDQLNEDLKRAEKEARRQLSTLMAFYDVFWCAPITHGDNALTKEQVQAKIDSNPAAAQVLLSASKDTLAFHKAQDPELVAEMVPDRYFLDGAYEWLPNSLTLDKLRPEFDIQPDE
jgi:hypothetical protein